jgi:4-amino-4-deoxy-L-arabinose transferase-like glycosyltransferase
MRLRLILILILALGIRMVAFFLTHGSRVSWSYEYEEIADNLIQHGQYAFSFYGLSTPQPSSFLPPAYPLLLAFCRMLFNTSATAIILLQIILSVVSVWLIFLMTKEMKLPNSAGLAAALLFSIYPPMIAYSVSLGTTTLETFFLLAGIWLTYRAVNKSSWICSGIAGILLGLAALTRSPWILAIPLATLWILFMSYQRRNVLVPHAAILLLASALTLSPWVVYNYHTHGKLLLTSTNGGLNLWIGNNPRATGEYVFPTEMDNDLVLSVADWPEVERDQFFLANAITFIESQPRQALGLALKKLFFYFLFRPNIGSTYEGTDLPIQLASLLFITAWILLLPFSIIGLWALRKKWDQQLLSIALFLSQGAVAMAYFAGTRFRTPVDSFVIIWAGVGLATLFSRWQNKGSVRIEDH